MQFIEIEEIKEISFEGKVYDLSVEEDTSYTIEDIVVHNSACTTWNSTGFGSRNMQAYFVKECALHCKALVIADGGIKHHGDISKALVMGADVVMIGGMLAGFIDSPGEIVEHDNKRFKEFWGSASEFQGNKKNRIEGKKYLVELKNEILLQEYQKITESLQSAISYAGGKNLTDFMTVEYVRI